MNTYVRLIIGMEVDWGQTHRLINLFISHSVLQMIGSDEMETLKFFPSIKDIFDSIKSRELIWHAIPIHRNISIFCFSVLYPNICTYESKQNHKILASTSYLPSKMTSSNQLILCFHSRLSVVALPWHEANSNILNKYVLTFVIKIWTFLVLLLRILIVSIFIRPTPSQ